MNISKETIERITREMINTPSPVSYYEEIHPLLDRLCRCSFGYHRFNDSSYLLRRYT